MVQRDGLSNSRIVNSSKRIPRKSPRSCRIQNVIDVMEPPNMMPHNQVLGRGIIDRAIDAVITTHDRYAARTIRRGPINGFSVGNTEPGSARTTYKSGLYWAGSTGAGGVSRSMQRVRW